MNIEELLNKYFEGETSCEEERELRHFFTQGIVPEHLKEYSPLFAFLEKENRQAKTTDTEPATKQRRLRRHAIYTLSGIAAGLLLLLGIAGIHVTSTLCPTAMSSSTVSATRTKIWCANKLWRLSAM